MANKFFSFFYSQEKDQMIDNFNENKIKTRHLSEYNILSADNTTPEENNAVYGRVIYKTEDINNQTEGFINVFKEFVPQHDGPLSALKTSSTPKPLGFGDLEPETRGEVPHNSPENPQPGGVFHLIPVPSLQPPPPVCQ